ncbi:MAG: G1 family glutamic endopeptidase [Candidatus Dormibacteraceae bacterium]
MNSSPIKVGFIAGLFIVLTLLGVVPALAVGSRAPVYHPSRHDPINPLHNSNSSGWESENWAGYALTGGPYREISASWVVPQVEATQEPSNSALFIGIDGYNNSSLLQVGTEQDYQGSGQYYAWWEMLPAPESRITSVPIHPGDQMSASLQEGLNGQWTIRISDLTTNQSFSTTQSYSAPRSSAEWVIEAPKVGGQSTKLAHYGQVNFSHLSLDGAVPELSTANRGTMLQDGQPVSAPSRAATSGFTVSYGE